MTLRVDISIVPYGVEDEIYQINRIDISNIGVVRNLGFGNVYCSYEAKLYEAPLYAIRNGRDEEKPVDTIIIPEHNRKDGALELVKRVLNELTKEKYIND